MKKLNQVGTDSATPRTRAQSKPAQLGAQAEPTAASLGNEIACFDDQRLFRSGREFTLVTGETEVRERGGKWRPLARSESFTDFPERRGVDRCQPLTREQARTWLDETVIADLIPDEFQRDFRHRKGSPGTTAGLTLGELLDPDAIAHLDKLAAGGIPVAAQVGGAVQSWLSYAEHFMKMNPASVEYLKTVPGILAPEHYEGVIARERSAFLTEKTARFFRSLVSQAKQMPIAAAVSYLGDLADLIEGSPGLVDEHTALNEFIEAGYRLGKSAAVEEALAS